MSSQLSDEQLAALQRTEENVAAIAGTVIRAVKNADQSELSARKEQTAFSGM